MLHKFDTSVEEFRLSEYCKSSITPSKISKNNLDTLPKLTML